MVAAAGVVADIAPPGLFQQFPLVADDVVASVHLGAIFVERYVEHETVVGPRTELQMTRLHTTVSLTRCHDLTEGLSVSRPVIQLGMDFFFIIGDYEVIRHAGAI